jgi:hypothetical protein
MRQIPFINAKAASGYFALAVPEELYEKLTDLLSSNGSIAKQEAERK